MKTPEELARSGSRIPVWKKPLFVGTYAAFVNFAYLIAISIWIKSQLEWTSISANMTASPRMIGLLIVVFLCMNLLVFAGCIPGLVSRRLLKVFPVMLLAAWVGAIVYGESLEFYKPDEGEFRCFLETFIFGLVPTFVYILMARILAPTHVRWLGFSIFLAGALNSALLLELFCQAPQSSHYVVSHWLPALAMGFVGLKLGRFILRW